MSAPQVHTLPDPASRDPIPLREAPRTRGPGHGRTSLGQRWAVAVGLLVLNATGLLGWISIDQQQRHLTEQMDLFGKTMAAQLAGAAAEPLLAEDRLALRLLLEQLPKDTGLCGAALAGAGRVLISRGILPPSPRTAPASGALEWEWLPAGGTLRQARSYWAPIRFANLDAGVAIVTLDADALDQGMKSALNGTLLASLVLIAAAVGTAVWLGRRLARPWQTLASLSGSAEAGASVCMPGSGAEREIGRIVEAFNRLAAGVREKDRLEQLLNRCVPVPLTRHLPQDPLQSVTQTVTVEGSVLFCDVTGFTALSEPLPPDRVVALLNEYFLYITSAAHSCGGVVDSFAGDCVMVVFADADPLHALHAATCALLIRDTVARVNERRLLQEQAPVRFRIGVNSGPMALCFLGGCERMQPTVIGDTVNLAARLCGLGHPGEITLGEATATAPEVGRRLRLTPLARQPVRGRHQEVTPFRAEALADEHQGQLRDILNRILPRETT